MKKLITSAFLALVLFHANAATDPAELNTQASDIARRMANQVELNEMEYIQVKKYTLEKLSSVAMIKDMYSNDLEMMTRKLQEVESAYSARIQNLLSAKQLETYASLQNSFKTNFTIIASQE